MAIPEIDVWQGEIGELEVDAIIVPANESLFMTGRTAGGLKRRAGDEVERQAVAQGPVPAGSVVVTDAGELAAAWLLHTVAVGHDLRADARQFGAALEAALARAEELGARRVAMAPLGVERGVFTASESAELTIESLARHPALHAVVAVASPADAAAFADALETARAGAR